MPSIIEFRFGQVANMKTQIKLFAILRERAATNQIVLTLRENAKVSELLTELDVQYPGLLLNAESTMIAVNTEYVTPDHCIKDGDEVALIPPVSGGAEVRQNLQGHYK